MADVILVYRFFRTVSPLPPLMTGTFVGVAAVASAVVLVDVERTADVLVPVLALQLFASASGFAGPARRGHYDMLLTSGDRRVTIGVIHWLMSIGPGLGAWLWVAGVEAAVRQGFPALALAAGSAAALTVVSTLSWAFTVALPRFAGAIGWLVTLVGAMSLWRVDQLFDEAGSTVVEAVAALVNPAVLIGRPLDFEEALAVIPLLVLGVTAVSAASAWIAWTDYPLEASQ